MSANQACFPIATMVRARPTAHHASTPICEAKASDMAAN